MVPDDNQRATQAGAAESESPRQYLERLGEAREVGA